MALMQPLTQWQNVKFISSASLMFWLSYTIHDKLAGWSSTKLIKSRLGLLEVGQHRLLQAAGPMVVAFLTLDSL